MPFTVAVDSDPVRRIEEMLFPNEILLWTGAPNRVFRFPRMRSMTWQTSLLPWVISMLVILVFFRKIVHDGWWWMVLLIAAPIFLILMTTYIFEPIRRANMYYAITNRRAIIISRRGEREPRWVSLGAIASFELTQDFTGAGSIDCLVPGHPDFDYPDKYGGQPELGALFEYISDPGTVLALLKRQSNNATTS